jgi:hypothetical protein
MKASANVSISIILEIFRTSAENTSETSILCSIHIFTQQNYISETGLTEHVQYKLNLFNLRLD